MTINKKVLYWMAAVVLIVITFWLGHFHKTAGKLAEKKTIPVEVETVTTGSIEETIELTGWIEANKLVDITSKVAGRIESLQAVLDDGGFTDVEEGLAVKKGQQLAVIDHDIYIARLAAANAELQTRQVESADTQREQRRIIGLYEAGSATEQNKDKAVTAAKLAQARLELAKANVELAEITLRESTIVSPVSGIVTAKYIDEGNLITAGQRIATVAEMKTVKVILAVAEKYGAKITVGMPAKIKVDAFGDREFEAAVYSIYPALDAQTHTIQIEIRIKNDRLLLKPGMFARVTLITRHKDDVVVVGRDVVLGGKVDEPYVYVVEETVARKRFVKVGISQAEKYEITDGLKKGESLVVNGMHYLADGMGVEVVRIEDIR